MDRFFHGEIEFTRKLHAINFQTQFTQDMDLFSIVDNLTDLAIKIKTTFR